MRANPEKRSTFVSFSGMDGAGKSTQIASLRARMEEAGLRVRIVTFWDDVARLTHLREVSGHKIFKGDKGIGSPERPINRRDKNVRSWKMTLVRYFLYCGGCCLAAAGGEESTEVRCGFHHLRPLCLR